MLQKNYEGYQVVWVFNGEDTRFPSAIFSTKELAEKWIAHNLLTGVLSAYPLDISIYDWVLTFDQSFKRKLTDEKKTPEFKQRYVTALQDIYHYRDGKYDI